LDLLVKRSNWRNEKTKAWKQGVLLVLGGGARWGVEQGKKQGGACLWSAQNGVLGEGWKRLHKKIHQTPKNGSVASDWVWGEGGLDEKEK